MTAQETHAAQDIAAQSTIDSPIPKDVADRFGISGFRTEKFRNHDEDLSKVDSAYPELLWTVCRQKPSP